MEKTTIIIMTPIFIILFVVILQAIKSMLDLNETSSFVLAACVSMLSIMGIVRYLNDSLEVILLPYAAMAIAIILVLLISVIAKYFKDAKDHFSNRTRKNTLSKYDDEKRKR
jgi:predicted permease